MNLLITTILGFLASTTGIDVLLDSLKTTALLPL